MDFYGNQGPSTSRYDGPIMIQKYRPNNNQDGPLDFSLKKQETDEENDLICGPVGGNSEYFRRVFAEDDALPFGKNDLYRLMPRSSEFEQFPLSHRFHQTYRSKSGSVVDAGPGEVQSQSKRSKKKPKALRPHELTKQLIEEPIHRPQSPDSVLEGIQMVPTRIDPSYGALSSFRSGWPSGLDMNQWMLGRQSSSHYLPATYLNSLPDRSPFPVRLSAIGRDLPLGGGASTPVRGLSPVRNGRRSPEGISPSDIVHGPRKLYPSSNGLSSPKREKSPTFNSLSSHKMDKSPTRNGLPGCKMDTSPTRKSLPSHKMDTSPTLNGLPSHEMDTSPTLNGLLSSPKKETSPTRNGLPSSGEDIPLSRKSPSSTKESENCQSSQDVAQTSSNNEGGITSSYQNDQSPLQDKPNNEQASMEKKAPSPLDNSSALQNLLTVKTDQFSPDSYRFSPDGTGSDQSQMSMSPMGQADSSSGSLFAKRRKGNPVPESEKNEAYVMKRMKNNVAAKKSREKRREHEQMLTKKAQELVAANQELKMMNTTLIAQAREYHAEISIMKQKLLEEQMLRVQAEKILKDLRALTVDCRRCADFFYG